MSRVIILGGTGMLGSMVQHYLGRTGKFNVLVCSNVSADVIVAGGPLPRFATNDIVINCIGVIKPFCRFDDAEAVAQAIRVNALFPHVLARDVHEAGARLIQIATDCVYSGKDGGYIESAPHDALDVYGKTKSLGEPFTAGVLNIRCSLVGPEAAGRKSQLLEWFLSRPLGSSIDGYEHHRWNGVTTLQFARLCEMLIEDRSVFQDAIDISPRHHFVPNEIVTKFELLQLFGEIFDHSIELRRVDNIGEPVDRSLSTSLNVLGSAFPTESLRSALLELRQCIDMFRADTAPPKVGALQ